MPDAWTDTETAAILTIRENLWNLLGKIGQTFIDGTAHDSKFEGACTPAQFGASLVLPLFFKVNTILVERGEEDWTGRLS